MMIKLTSTNEAPIYFAPSAVEAVWTGPGGPATVFTGNESFSVRESAAEVVALIESSRQPAADADYAPLVDAARRLVAWMDTPTPWSKDADRAVVMQRIGNEHDRIVESLRAALDAVREDAARDSVDLSAALRAMTAERDEARRDLAAALRVVDAARRMVTWADDAWTGRSIPEHERIVEAIRSALAAYVKGDAR